MTAKEIKLASACDWNHLWKCYRKSETFNTICKGPCKFCSSTQIKFSDIKCPICDSPASEGYCSNKLCVNHG
jgi:3-methyladenine DNA glycosylase Mpg